MGGSANSAADYNLLSSMQPAAAAMQPSGSAPSAGPATQNQMQNPNAMYRPQNQVPVTNTANVPQTALPGSINSSNPNLTSPPVVGAVGGYSPLTMQQPALQQKMGSNNATMK